MDFIVNRYTTIKNFKPVEEFETKMKFGKEYDYQRFFGELNGNKVTGQICLDDEQIYGLEEVIELISVGSGINKITLDVYAMYKDGTFDVENASPLSECIQNKYWFKALSVDDANKIVKLQNKKL